MTIIVDGVECCLLTEVAELCGVGEERLNYFRGGYSHLENFPKPVRKRFQSCSGARGGGRALLFVKAEIEEWVRHHDCVEELKAYYTEYMRQRKDGIRTYTVTPDPGNSDMVLMMKSAWLPTQSETRNKLLAQARRNKPVTKREYLEEIEWV
jgi:hypothetical protein